MESFIRFLLSIYFPLIDLQQVTSNNYTNIKETCAIYPTIQILIDDLRGNIQFYSKVCSHYPHIGVRFGEVS